ncbi:hypothetical protein VPH166E361_0136 [Vibrio phage 166E36-1]
MQCSVLRIILHFSRKIREEELVFLFSTQVPIPSGIV